MTYIELINNFWRLDKEQEFSSVETKLYFLLLETANSFAWRDSFQLSNDRLFARFTESANTVRAARNKLQQIGLITFSSAKKKNERTKYTIWGSPAAPQLEPHSAPQLEPHSAPQLEPINRQDKDKDIDIRPEKENYYVVKEKAPHSPLFDAFFAPQRQADLEALAMNLGVSIQTLREVARECLIEWNVTDTSHSDQREAFRHLVSHIRRKVEYRRQQPQLPEGSLQERKNALWTQIQYAAGTIRDADDVPLLTADDCKEFFNYWIETNREGTLMRFECEPFFNTINRLRSWIAKKRQ